MLSKYGLLSLLVLGLVLLLIFKNYEIWTQPVKWVPERSIRKIPQRKPENMPEVRSTFGSQKNPTSVKSFISIAEKNVFSPDRKDFPISPAKGKNQLVRPQVILYGVTISGDYEAASVANPGRPLQKGERETFTVRKGEQIAGYKLVKISSDRVTLEAEGDSFEVLLYDRSAAKRRSDIRTESKPATITSTQPVSPIPGTPLPGGPGPGAPVPGTPVPGGPVPGAPVPGAPVPTPTTPPTVSGSTAPVGPGAVNPALPRPDFPRRRGYYPPSAPSQRTGGN